VSPELPAKITVTNKSVGRVGQNTAAHSGWSRALLLGNFRWFAAVPSAYFLRMKLIGSRTTSGTTATDAMAGPPTYKI
jgi:hypothetical protein